MDKEEIIRRLKKISGHAVHIVGEQPFIMSLDDGIALDEAVRLLKEQKAVKPIFSLGKDGIFVWTCGSCGAHMYCQIHDGIDKAKEYAKFCRQCGKPVLWEG